LRCISGLGRLEGQRQAQGHGGDQIDPENLHRSDGQGQAQQNRRDDDNRLTAVGRQGPGNDLAQVFVDGAPFLDGGDDGGEVVVGQHHACGLLGGSRAGDAHGHTDVGPLECRCVVDAVTSHGDDAAICLQGLHQAQLVFRTGTGKYRGGSGHVDQLGIVEPVQLMA
jgi:hypothetical protein